MTQQQETEQLEAISPVDEKELQSELKPFNEYVSTHTEEDHAYKLIERQDLT